MNLFISFLKLWENRIVGPWSSIRHKNDVAQTTILRKINSVTDIELLSKDIKKKFQYKHDGILELGDSMRPPAQCYQSYKLGALVDDCDGFHAALYYAVEQSGLPAKLFTIASPIPNKGHTILAYQIRNKWGYQDYTSGEYGWNTIEELIDYLFQHYSNIKPLFASVKSWDSNKKQYICEVIIDAGTNQ